MRRWIKLVLLVGLPAMAITWYVAWSGDGFFGCTEICTTCGRTRSTTRAFWMPSSRIEETELSKFYDAHTAGNGNHDHEWLFAAGGGGAIVCAIGGGSYLFSAINNEGCTRALEAIREMRGEDEVDEWLGRLLDPELSSAASSALMILAGGAGEFETAYRDAQETYSSMQATTDRENLGGQLDPADRSKSERTWRPEPGAEEASQ